MQKPDISHLSDKDQHRVRMQAKRIMRARLHNAMKGPAPYIPANLSRNHPDYGMSMADHLVEKARRNSEKSS